MTTTSLAIEWERVDLLAQCVYRARRGEGAPETLMARLQQVHRDVMIDREERWSRQPLYGAKLTDLELDVLVCVVAPEAEPRLGWLYQALQPGPPHPHPTPALVQELLAMDVQDSVSLYGALTMDAPLRRNRLIDIDGEGPFHPLRPGPGISARLLGRPAFEQAPPACVRVATDVTWRDLVLPPDRVAVLKEFLCWIRHRAKVASEWGGRISGGPVALFAGASGTGKTLAASVIAADLGWPLFRVDIGCLVSKYIGETEKNMNALFDAVHGRQVVLQIDEADSLFGKRGEIKEARDRYANLEISHLLTRIEAHDGPCILTTNLRRNIDPAFTRRFHVVVDFPRPQPGARATMWQLLLPPGAPVDHDVDVSLLGREVNLTGGGIHNAAMHAAVLAAEADAPISYRELATGVWRELAKDGRDLTRVDLGALADYVPENIVGDQDVETVAP